LLSSLLFVTVAVSVARNNIERQNSEYLERRTQELIEENKILQAQWLREFADKTESEKAALLADAQQEADLIKQQASERVRRMISASAKNFCNYVANEEHE
jgi:DNA integrity scanning protein DisA with diadenylate cyclase activity